MTEQNNEQMVSNEASSPNGNGGNSKKILFGITGLALVAAIVFFVYRSLGIRSPKALLGAYAATVERMEKQVEYQQTMQKQYLNKQADSKLTLELKNLPQGVLPFPNVQLNLGLKNDPEGKRLQFLLAALVGEKQFLSTTGELNDAELLVDIGDYSEKMIALPTKEFGAKLKAFNEEQGSGETPIDETMDISYSKLMEKLSLKDRSVPQEYKEAMFTMVEGVKVDKVAEGYQMIIPNQNVRASVNKLFEAMKKDPRLPGMDLTQNREVFFDNLLKSIEESDDEITLDVFTKVSDGIVTESKVRVLKNGEEEVQSLFTIADTKEVLKGWTWKMSSATDEKANFTMTGQGTLSKEKTDYSISATAGEQMTFSMNFGYGDPEASGDLKVEASLMMNGRESMSFLLSGKYSNENNVQKFVSDIGTIRFQNGMSDELSEVNFSLESQTKPAVDSFYTFTKEKYMPFDATKEENDAFVQSIFGMLFMKMMGM